MTRKRNLHSRDQISWRKRLDDIRHCSSITSPLNKFCLAKGSEHDDRTRKLGKDLLSSSDTIHLRHLDVHHTKVRLQLKGKLHSFFTVRSLANNFKARTAQRLNDIQAD